MEQNNSDDQKRKEAIENLAAKIVERLEPGIQAVRYDCDGRQSAHDFDLCRNGRPCAALEVTSTTIQERAKALSAVRSWRPTLPLRRSWEVLVREGNAISRHERSELEKFLISCEDCGRLKFDSDEVDYPDDIQEIAEQQGLLTAAVIDLERGAQISVTVIFSGGGKIAEAPDKLRDTIEQVAEKDDNVLKLRNSGRNKHHLFIWIDRRTDVDNQFTLTDIGCNVLSIAPQLPAEIDVLWVATDDWNGGFFVWRLEPPSPWQAFACRLEDLSMS